MSTIIVNRPERCMGCRICEMICSLKNGEACSPELSKIKVYYDPFTAKPDITISEDCIKCIECIKWCPAGVLKHRKGDGDE